MVLAGKQKAAMLLMSMEPSVATELLRGLPVEEIEEIGIELARLDAKQRDAKEETKVMREFAQRLQKKQSRKANLRTFLNETLLAVVGKEHAERIQSKIGKTTAEKDVFAAIRSANVDELVLALENELPQTVAVVLSELDTKKSQEILPLLEEELRLNATCRMASQGTLGAGVKERMASMISARLESFKGEAVVERPGKRGETLRKLAIVLSGLEKGLRNNLLDEIKKHDKETSSTIRNLMMTWDDVPSIADRSLQEALRTVDAGKLAISLFGADEEIVQKIRSNISERLVQMLDEEASLMQEPLPKEVLEAREEIVKPLRKANEEDKLRFAEQR